MQQSKNNSHLLNNSRRFLFVSLLVIALLALSACEGGSKTKGRSSKDVQGIFLGGSEGVTLSFEENSPPATIFASSGQSFDIGVVLKNNGESAIAANQAKVKISGLNPSDLDLKNPVLSISEEIGKREKTAEGSEITPPDVYARFPGLQYKVALPQGASKDVDLRAELCYPYETNVVAELCVLENPLGPNPEDKVCNFQETVPTANSGSPLRVSQIKENGRNDEIQFVFTLAHDSAGDEGKILYKDGTDCFSDDTATVQRARNLVRVAVDTLGKLQGLKCAGFTETVSDTAGYFKLPNDGKPSSLVCKFPVKNVNTDFSEFININLKYQYKDRVETKLSVKS